jgi:hypothetical protein
MGLLDDAIREHLELKKRHGADPGEVARQEREVLGDPRAPAAEDAPAPTADAGDDLPSPEAEATRIEQERSAPADLPPDPDLPPAAPPAPPHPEVRGDSPAPAPSPIEPDLDWSDPPSGAADEPEAAPADEEEDVLEETPDFLQETPEHDRLWFEQRPPRDFDF